MKINFADPEFLSNCRVFSRCQRPLKINLGVPEISPRNFRPFSNGTKIVWNIF